MHLDVTQLRAFYLSPLGGVARRVIARHIRAKWRRIPGETLIGIGYATPYIGSYRGEVLRLGRLHAGRTRGCRLAQWCRRQHRYG